MRDRYFRVNNTSNSRLIDFSAQKTYETVGQRFMLISKREVRTWKAISIVTFFAGIFATAIYFSAYRLEITKISAEASSWTFGQNN
jgi:hypothetical protein